MMKFGVEIEVLTSVSREVMARKMAEKGVAVEVESYNHRVRPHWKIVTDSSCGYEVVSPILYGEAGLEEIKKVSEALKEVGAQINSSCGLHVHHDARELDLQNWKTLLINYRNYEKVIDSFMPSSRRGTRNQYCRTMRSRGVTNEMIENAPDLNTLQYYFGSRFMKLNVHSFVRHGTVEFRQHSGSVEAEKINNWVKLTFAMLEKAKRNEVMTESRPNLQKFLSELFNEEVAMTTASAPRRAPRAGTMMAAAARLFEAGISDRVAYSMLREQFPENRSLNERRVRQMRKNLSVVVATASAPMNTNEVANFYNARAAHFAA